MKKKVFLLSIICLFGFTLQAQWECDTEESSSITSPDSPNNKSLNCVPGCDPDSYIPYYYNTVPEKKVSVYFHIVQKSDGTENFPDNSWGHGKLAEYITNVNTRYKNLAFQNPPGTCPLNPSEHIVDSKISFHVTGTQFYQDDDYWCTDTKCITRADSVYDYVVKNNPNLTQAEKDNNLHLILVGVRGVRQPNEGCDRNETGCLNNCANCVDGIAGRGEPEYSIFRGIEANNWETDNITEIFAHEIGHTLGLAHSWHGQCCDASTIQDGTNNIMDYSVDPTINNPNLDAFTPCQLGIMHRTIELNNPQFLINDLCEQQSPDIVIPANTTVYWEEDKTVSQNIRVYGTLELSCTYTFAKDVFIEVQPSGKLHVHGATLTSCSNEQWDGIYVVGSSGTGIPGIVDIDQGAIVENAKVAVRTYPYPWITSTSYYGGLFFLEEVTFNDCDRVIAQTAYTPFSNASEIINCTINGGGKAITIWNASDTDIIGNTFNGISDMCIKVEDAHVNIKNNTCNSYNIGMYLGHEFNGISSIVHNNIINATNIGILSQGSAASSHKIDLNDITSAFGIILDRDNNYDITSNNFNGGFVGLHAGDNGGNANYVVLNEFNGNGSGIYANDDNSGFSFLENCFNFISSEDVFVSGELFSDQGNPDGEAGNCFTKNTIPDINVLNGGGFNYYSYQIDPNACNVPVSPPSGYNLLDGLENPGYNDCGAGYGGVYSLSYCHPMSLVPVEIKISAILLQINNLQNLLLGGTTQTQKTWINAMLRVLKRCLRRLRHLKAERHLIEMEYDSARLIYNLDSTFLAKTRIFSSYILERDFASAISYLNTLDQENLSDAEQNFVDIQRIVTQRQEDGVNFVLSETDSTFLLTTCFEDHPYVAYARTLFYQLTDSLIYDQLTIQSSQPTIGNNFEVGEVDIDTPISLYPNPSVDILRVDLLENKEVTLTVSDLQGNIYHSADKVSGIIEINTAPWNIGMYFIVVEKEGQIIQSEKFLLSK